MKKQFFKIDIFSLSVLFFLGELTALLPNTLNFWSLLIFFIIEAFVLGAVMLWDKKIISFLKKHFILKRVLLFLILVFSIYCTVETLKVFAIVLRSYALNEISKGVIAIILLLLSFYIILRGNNILKKIATVFFPILFCFVFILVFASIIKSEKNNFKEIFMSPLNLDFFVFFKSFFSLVFLPLYFKFIGERKYDKSLCYGLLSGFIFAVALSIIPIMIFGTNFSSVLSFPIFDAVGSISVGTIFTRLDALLYFILFSTAIIKVSLLMYCFVSIVKNIFKREKPLS